ncbi:MAG: gluconate 2-dehydrogenase subunit 3 family protein, partial [Roseicyclus sp.]
MSQAFSRRAVLQTAGASGLAAAVGLPAIPRHAFAQADSRPWAILTDTEARWLAAACDVLIPEDEYPSASQAGVVDFIDLQMATGYGQGEGLYLQGPFFEGTESQGWQIDRTPAELLLQGIAELNDEDTPIFDLDETGRADFVRRLSEREQPIGGGTPA